MQALLEQALLPVNIAFTVLLVFVALYWLTVLIGIIDISSFDVDLDFEADIDAEVDVDADTDIDGESGGSWLGHTLQFFNFGRVPFMIVLSFLVLSMWAISILINYYWGYGSWTTALILLLPNLATSLLLTKMITSPLVPVFKHFDGSETAVDYIGQECTLTLPVSSTSMGQAEVMINDTPLRINVKLAAGDQLNKGAKALIVNEDSEGRYYMVRELVE
jgi:hypothetical protein